MDLFILLVLLLFQMLNQLVQYQNLKYYYYTDLKQILERMKKCINIMSQQRIMQIEEYKLVSSFFSYNLPSFIQLIQPQNLSISFAQ